MAQSVTSQSDFNPTDLRSPYEEQTVSPAHPRNPFRRQTSWVNPSARYQHLAPVDQDIAEQDEFGYEHERAEAHGLGLSNVPSSAGASIVKRKPIHPLPSPDPYASGHFSQATTAQNSGNLGVENGSGLRWAVPSTSSIYSQQEGPYKHMPDNTHLITHDHAGGSHACPTRGDLLKPGWTGFTILILVLGVFSWVFSAVLLGLGVARPRWGRRIGTHGALSYDAATLLSALVSKLVELSFCTTFVATLGQILTRRAFASAGTTPGKQGISLAEMNMRLWIMQPGTLITHWTGAKFVLTTLLGVVTLIAALSATFYTTAAEALVSPKLKFGRNETLQLYGQVSTSYSNVKWLAEACDTPVPTTSDPLSRGTTCLQIDFAGNGYRNLNSWLSAWKEVQDSGDNVEQAALRPRPPPTAVLYDNTTVHGQWIKPSGENITADSAKFGRYVQNATIVMPHNNVLQAARYSRNKQILQPNDLQGAGAYYLSAAVPAPAINALCVGIQTTEVAPLILNHSTYDGLFRNFTTPIDHIFNWSMTPDNINTWPHPWFEKAPKEFNTIANTTNGTGNPANFIIAKPPSTVTTNDYVICGVRSFLFNNCSTNLFVASSGSDLSVHCNSAKKVDPQIWKPYAETVNKTSPPPMVVQAPDYRLVSFEWVRAVGLTSGVHDGDASAERLLTQLIPPFSKDSPIKLSPTMPSIAEALCVLSSYTLLVGSSSSPFVHYWDYAYAENNILGQPAEVRFPAILSYKDYSSGGDQNWKGIFYVILATVFILNTFCLICLLYYFLRYGEVTDYTEPQNLFALAINSPPSNLLAGACGAGPSSQMLGKKWCVDMLVPEKGDDGVTSVSGIDPQHVSPGAPHFFVRYPEEEPLLASAVNTPTTTNRFSTLLSPSSPAFKRRSKRSSMGKPLSEYEMEESPAVAQYMKLVGR